MFEAKKSCPFNIVKCSAHLLSLSRGGNNITVGTTAVTLHLLYLQLKLLYLLNFGCLTDLKTLQMSLISKASVIFKLAYLTMEESMIRSLIKGVQFVQLCTKV